MATHEFQAFLADSYGGLVTGYQTGLRKHKFKSPRKCDNDDDDNYETVTMIRQQLYGPGGPYENLMVNQIESELMLHCFETLQAKCKRGPNEKETIFGQQHAKKPKLGSSEFKHLTEAMADLKPDTDMQPTLSFSTDSHVQQFKSPYQSKNDHAFYRSMQILLYENMQVNQSESESSCSKTLQATRKRSQNEEEITFYQQPAKNQAKAYPVYTQLIPCSSTGSREPQFVALCKSADDDDNHITIPMILQQLLGSNEPHETPGGNQTESETYFPIILQTEWNSCQDDQKDEEKYTFGQKPANNPNLGVSDLEHLSESGLTGSMSNVKQINAQQISSISTGSRKHQFKSPRKYDNDDDDNNYETTAMIHQQLYGPGGPYENLMVNQTKSESC